MERVIHFNDLPATPWKNGGGVTVELLAAPQGATIANFDFRISVATVSQDGPFSVFPGIDRTLALVDGEGLTLHMEGGRAVTVDAGNPSFSFAGEAGIHATVNDGTTMDFNVMSHRGRCSHELEICELGAHQQFTPKGDFSLLFVAKAGGTRITLARLGMPPATLDQFDTVLLDPSKTYDMAGPGSTLFIVDIFTQTCTAS
jgi:environmental stress-induced protein Ves